MDPTTKPKFAVVSQANTNQTRASALKRSSILPATTIEGIADNNPVTKRPMNTAAIDGTAAMIKQKIVHRNVDTT